MKILVRFSLVILLFMTVDLSLINAKRVRIKSFITFNCLSNGKPTNQIEFPPSLTIDHGLKEEAFGSKALFSKYSR